MGWQSGRHGIHEKCREYVSEDLKGMGYLEHISIIWRVILKYLEEVGSWDMD
jgi:hypothetical protein